MHRILVIPKALDIDFRSSFLRRDSFEIRRAETAAQAFAIAADWRPGLILLGSHLSDMPAARFCEVARKEPSLRTTKLLMLTYQCGADGSDLTQVDCDAHMLEPIDVGQLMHTIGSLLDVEVRRGPRVPVELLAQIEAKDDGEAHTLMANVLNLSDNGMLLECELHLHIGAVVDVHFFLPGVPARMSVACMVLFGDELKLHYGVEFFGLEPAQKASIRAFIAAAELGEK